MDIEVISVITRNFATAFAVVITAALAIWKWGFEERLRQRKEVPSPDGNLAYKIESMRKDFALLTVTAEWRNKGSLPIHLNNSLSTVSVYLVDEKHELGTLKSQDCSVLINSQLCDGEYIMEPNTDSIMQKHFVVPAGKLILVKWVIALHQQHSKSFGGEGVYICSRELIINTG